MTSPRTCSTVPIPDSEPVSSILLTLFDLELDLVGIDADTELLEAGHLDSLALIELILAIEHTFGLAIGDDDLRPERFASIRSIAGLVEDLR